MERINLWRMGYGSYKTRDSWERFLLMKCNSNLNFTFEITFENRESFWVSFPITHFTPDSETGEAVYGQSWGELGRKMKWDSVKSNNVWDLWCGYGGWPWMVWRAPEWSYVKFLQCTLCVCWLVGWIMNPTSFNLQIYLFYNYWEDPWRTLLDPGGEGNYRAVLRFSPWPVTS